MNSGVPDATFLDACSTKYRVTSAVLIYALPSATKVGNVAFEF